jgi:hypothetical protein
MGAFHNTTMGLLRWAGQTNMATACRRLAAQPVQALTLMGMALENVMTLPLSYALFSFAYPPWPRAKICRLITSEMKSSSS